MTIAGIRLRLIAEWRDAWRYWSVKLNGLSLLLLSATQITSEAWNSMPQDLRSIMPYARWVSIGLLAIGLFARFIAQPQTADVIQQKTEARNG